jgi:RNA polymerase sigma-B factor
MDLSEGVQAVETQISGGATSVSQITSQPTRCDQQDRDLAFNGNHVREDQTAVNGLIRRIQDDDDQRALSALMAEFDWVAVKCARRMYRRGESIEDLEQVAREALLGAVARFDVHRGVAFKAFAWSTAMGILRHHYRSRWQVRVPRRLQELHLATMQAIQHLSAVEGRAPTVDELADHLHADRDDVILALDAGHAYRAGSLAEPLNDHRGGTMRHERTLGTLDEAIESIAERTHVREMLASLPLRQRQILVMRFFEGRTQTEIGQSLGISQVQVSRLIRAALDTLRDRAGDR